MSVLNTPPPVAQRPRCPACDKPLRPFITHDYVRVNVENGFRSEKVAQPWGGTYIGYGAFCTLRCCEAYANAEFKRTGQRYYLAKATGSAKS